jgi:hypothetical protein
LDEEFSLSVGATSTRVKSERETHLRNGYACAISELDRGDSPLQQKNRKTPTLDASTDEMTTAVGASTPNGKQSCVGQRCYHQITVVMLAVK